MVVDERETQRGGLARHIAIEVLTTGRLPWLCDSRSQSAEVAEKGLLAALFHDETVKEQDLSEAEVPHYLRRS